MHRFSQIAAPAVLGAALLVGTQGCQNEQRNMPGNAQMMSEGRESVAAIAPHDGTVYIWDNTAHKNVYSGRVLKGDNVRLDSNDNKVMLNDRTAMEKDLNNADDYQIYFDRNEGPDAINASHRENGAMAEPNSTAVPQQQYQQYPQQQQYQQPQYRQPAPPPAAGSGATVVQPNGTVVQPGPNGGTTVTTPSGSRTTVEPR
jgi:hypothetical protein